MIENSVTRRNALERQLAIVKMIRNSSQEVRGKIYFKNNENETN